MDGKMDTDVSSWCVEIKAGHFGKSYDSWPFDKDFVTFNSILYLTRNTSGKKFIDSLANGWIWR